MNKFFHIDLDSNGNKILRVSTDETTIDITDLIAAIVGYDSTSSGLSYTDVQNAIDVISQQLGLVSASLQPDPVTAQQYSASNNGVLVYTSK